MPTDPFPRRWLLRAAGTGVVVAIAGCTGSDDEGMAEDEDSTETVRVGPDGEYVFNPDELSVASGTTVTFTWGSSGHTITIESAPDDSDWEGVPERQDEGYTHEHTFQTTGTYEYVCSPHREQGMTGTLEVDEGGGSGDSEEDGSGDSEEDGSDDSDGGVYRLG